MKESLNYVAIEGVVVKESETRFGTFNVTRTSVRVVTDTYTNKEGVVVTKSGLINVEKFGDTKYYEGDRIRVYGTLCIDSWVDKATGAPKQAIYIKADSIKKLNYNKPEVAPKAEGTVDF